MISAKRTTHERPVLDVRIGSCVVHALYRDRSLVSGELDEGLLYRRRRGLALGERDGYRSRLDECCVVHFNGGAHLVHGIRWRGLPHGLDRWVRSARAAFGSLSTEVRRIYGSGLCRRPLLLANRTDCGGGVCDIRVLHIRVWPDAGCGRRIQSLSRS